MIDFLTDGRYDEYVFCILESCIMGYITKEQAVNLLQGYQDYLLTMIFNQEFYLVYEDLCKTPTLSNKM